MTKNKPAPDTVFPRRLSFHPESRTVGLPLAGLAGRPVRELEMAAAGIDYLIHSFHAGTPSSPTHLVWFVAKGRIKCDYGVGPHVVRAGEMVICPAHSPHWIELASPKARGYWFHLRDVPRWQHLRAQGSLVGRAWKSSR